MNINPKDEGQRIEIRGSTPANPKEDQQATKEKEQQSAKDAAGTTDDD
jgi:hypothetical protein